MFFIFCNISVGSSSVANLSNIDVSLRPRLFHLRKWPNFGGYGFDLQCEAGTVGQFIGKVDYGSPAMVTGLRSGDKIIEVNGFNVESCSHADVIRKITSLPDEVRLLVVDDMTAAYHSRRGVFVTGDSDAVLYEECPLEQPGRLLLCLK